MRSADRVAAGLPQDVVHADAHSHPIQPLHDPLRPPTPLHPLVAQVVRQALVLHRKEIGEEVHLAPTDRDAELAPGDDADAAGTPGLFSLREPRQGIVIGQGDGSQSGSHRPLHYFRRGALAIRCRGVEVKVDRPHCQRARRP